MTSDGRIERSQEVWTAYEPAIDFGGVSVDSVPTGFAIDFSGSLRRLEFLGDQQPPQGRVAIHSLPIDEEVFEWMDIIESIEAARTSEHRHYRFAEFGAGYGRWGVRAYRLAGAAGILDRHLILVEAEPTHLKWLHAHLDDNRVPDADATILPAAITTEVGEALFYVGMPEGTPGNSPAAWYGQALTHDYERSMKPTPSARGVWDRLRRTVAGDAASSRVSETTIELESGWKATRVLTRRIRDCIPPGLVIDLADFDVQGAELDTIWESIDVCDRQVKMLHIGTHSGEIEVGLREILRAHDWVPVRDYGLAGTRLTELGPIDFVDGVQTWINPRLRTARYNLNGVAS